MLFQKNSFSQTNPDSIVISGKTSWQLIKSTFDLKVYSKESD
jgi:hypothetical protein